MTQQLTIEDAMAQRDEGMRQVAAGAKAKDPLFAGQAYAMLSLYAATNHGTFTADDVIFSYERAGGVGAEVQAEGAEEEGVVGGGVAEGAGMDGEGVGRLGRPVARRVWGHMH